MNRETELKRRRAVMRSAAIEDWKYEVMNDDTRSGFDDWLTSQHEQGLWRDVPVKEES